MSESEIHNPALVQRLKRIGIAILILGLLSAIVVFIFASEAPDNATAYQIIDGVSYPVDVNNTKSYNYNMERIAGKSGVFASDLDDWFSSLWHGKKLSYILAVLSIVSTLLCFWFAHLFSLPPHDDETENKDWEG
jgi:hypothetical protein